MMHLQWRSTFQRVFLLILPVILSITFLFPQHASAHAILVRSDPAKDSLLTAAPVQVRMWFSESLNPTFSTAYVVNETTDATNAQNNPSTHVDGGNAHVASGDNKEMDVSLKANLPAAVYVVVYQTQSANDGHILHGSFLFTVEASNGSIPKFTGQLPGQSLQGNSTGQLDGPAFFSFLMITLVELGAVFWAGAQFWRMFVLQFEEKRDTEEYGQVMEQRFARRFSLPALFLIFLANIGVLVGQALTITEGQVGQALNPQLLAGLVSQGQFGAYWLVREGAVLLAGVLAVYTLVRSSRSHKMGEIISWVDFFCALALLAAITLSGHAAATSSNIVVYAILVDFLHLLAAALWVGGMLYIALVYLPSLKANGALEQIRSLLTILPRYSPLAIAGVVIMALSGPFNATTHLNSWDELLNTMYGRTLLVKIALVVALLFTSLVHVFLLRPRLAKDFKKYRITTDALQHKPATEGKPVALLVAEQIKLLEGHIIKQSRRLTTVLRWEPVLGVAVLLCTGLLTVFSGTLQPATASQPQATPTQKVLAKPFTTTVTTKDTLFKVKLNVTPNRFGLNTFTATVFDSNGVLVPNNTVGVSLYTTMLDMDMGTDSINLQPDGKGNYSASGQLNMGGHWEVRIEIRTLDNTLHGVTVDFETAL